MSAMGAASVKASAPPTPREDLDALHAVLGRPVDSAERVGAGRNSRVYKVRCGETDYAAKFYFKPTADGRDRLQVEYSALEFLWQRGIRCIAQPVRADAGRQVALYQFVHGEPVSAGDASAGDIVQLLAFVAELKAIEADAQARALSSAAEAFFTVAGVMSNLRQRLARLDALNEQGAAYDALRRFLGEHFKPALSALGDRATAGSGAELAWEYRVLSPSDLGFHNSLRAAGGRLVFLDFEYFGWDDPAKTLSDCLLHPMMRLAAERRRQMAAGFDRIFGADPGWSVRVKAIYPLFALKWCMIMLNEFRLDQIERRRYVDRNAEEIEVIQMRQLESARGLLERTLKEQNA